MVGQIAGIPYFDLNSRPGAEEASKELGYSFIFTAPSSLDAGEQIQLVEAAVAQKVRAILIFPNDAEALCPALKKAMEAGIIVISWDTDVQAGCRHLYQNQASAESIGRGQTRIMCDLLGGPGKCVGEVAILSTTTSAANQNAWIKWMRKEWEKPEYTKMKLVTIAYGDDADQKSYDEASGLLESYPNLKGIISPTSVGLAAAARLLEDQGLVGKIQLTGLGLPNQLRQYVKSGVLPKFALWNPKNQGYLTVYMADALSTGAIQGNQGDTFQAGRLGDFTVGKEGVVLLGPPLIFDRNNIDKYDF